MIDADNLTGWKGAWRKPDRRPIHEWANDPSCGLVLPSGYAQPGRFNVHSSRHLIGPFEAVRSDSIREATWAGAIQTGKSLVVEVSIAWAIVNAPGPIMWTMQTDKDAMEQCNQRSMEMWKSCRGIRDILPQDRHKRTSAAIYFGPFFLEVNGANINNLQRVSVRWKFNSEVWLWKAGLLTHARGRVSAFERAGNSKVVNESQGGSAGDDFTKAFTDGDQQLWSVKCFSCGAYSPLEFTETARPEMMGKTCVVWNPDARREDGSWNIGRAAETSKWVCPKCGHEHENTPRTRARWNQDGDYFAMNPTAPKTKASFRWEALVAKEIGALTAQFLEARRMQKMGVTQGMQDFTRQQRALPWKDGLEQSTVFIKGAAYALDDAIKDKIDSEAGRFMTIDRQRDHFWAVVRAWRADGTSRLLFRSRVETVEHLRVVQQDYSVEDQLVFEDSGYMPDGAYTDCAAYGWTALKGSGDNYFTIELRGHKTKRMWSNATHVQHDGKLVPLIHWASDPIKDILDKLRRGLGATWEIPEDVGTEYRSQMDGEVKREHLNKRTGRMELRWFRTNQNHYWDCEAMQIAAALMLRLLAGPEVVSDEEKETAAK